MCIHVENIRYTEVHKHDMMSVCQDANNGTTCNIRFNHFNADEGNQIAGYSCLSCDPFRATIKKCNTNNLDIDSNSAIIGR